MRLATVSVEGEERIAAVINEEYIDLNKAYELLLERKGNIVRNKSQKRIFHQI